MQKKLVRSLKNLNPIFRQRPWRSLARKAGYLERSRVVAPDQLVWSLLQSFATHQVQGIAGIHRSFMHDSKRTISYSAFHDQLSKPEFLVFARPLCQDRCRTDSTNYSDTGGCRHDCHWRLNR